MERLTVGSRKTEVDILQQTKAERERRFQVVDQIKEHLPDLAADEVEKDVAEAVAAVRAKR